MFTVEDGFKVNPEACEFLNQLTTKVGVVAICGKYRTGKSYLLNKLFLERIHETKKKKGF